MSNNKYIQLYNEWKNKAINDGFTYKQFWYHCNIYISLDGLSNPEDCAMAAKLAYRSLHELQTEESKTIELELINCSWL